MDSRKLDHRSSSLESSCLGSSSLGSCWFCWSGGLSSILQKFWYNRIIFLSSSVVERSTVNRLVIGSNPIWGERKSYYQNQHDPRQLDPRELDPRELDLWSSFLLSSFLLETNKVGSVSCCPSFALPQDLRFRRPRRRRSNKPRLLAHRLTDKTSSRFNGFGWLYSICFF